MWTVLFADGGDGDVGAPVAEWVKTAGLIVSAVLIPAVTVFAGLYFRKRDRDAADRKDEVGYDAEGRKLTRKEKSEDDRRFDRLQDKINERIEENEKRCREELEGYRDELTALYRYVGVRETLVGRWMGRVAGWIDHAAEKLRAAGIEFVPFTEPPPEMPPLPNQTAQPVGPPPVLPRPPAGDKDGGTT